MSFPKATAVTSVLTILEPEIQYVWVTGCGQPATTISWPNTDFVTPPGGIWLEPFFRFGDAFNFQLGGPGVGTNLKLGLIFISFFAQKATGTRTIYGHAQKFLAHFTRTHFSGIATDIDDGPVNLSEESVLHFQVTVTFSYYELV